MMEERARGDSCQTHLDLDCAGTITVFQIPRNKGAQERRHVSTLYSLCACGHEYTYILIDIYTPTHGSITCTCVHACVHAWVHIYACMHNVCPTIQNYECNICTHIHEIMYISVWTEQI